MENAQGARALDGLFGKAVEAIYDAAPDPSRWPQALQAMADVFGDVGAVLVYERDDAGFGAISSRSLDALLLDYARGFHGQDLRAIRGKERGFHLGRDAVTDDDLVSAEEMESHAFYKLLAKHGLKYFVGGVVSPDPRVAVFLAIQRAPQKPPYSDDEIELHVRLCRHAEQSLRLSVRLLDAELVKAGLGDALSRLSIGVFALDPLGRVVFSNPAGERSLGNGLALVNDRLLVGPSPERAVLEAAISQAIRGRSEDLVAEPKPILIHRREGRPLTVYVLPIQASATPTHQFPTHAGTIALVIDPEADAPPPGIVRDVLGLTLAEARVASLVGSGVPPRKAAEQLGISEETTRTALKRVFSKVGVSRQSELAVLLTKLVLR